MAKMPNSFPLDQHFRQYNRRGSDFKLRRVGRDFREGEGPRGYPALPFFSQILAYSTSRSDKPD
jgi:hypothetical protein